MKNYNNWNINADDILEDSELGHIACFNGFDNSGIEDNIQIIHDPIPKKKSIPEPVKKAENTNGIINIIREPYNEGERLYAKKKYEFKPGVTVLVGCNGTGKTTLMHQIKAEVKKKEIPLISFDNLHDGGHNAVSSASFFDDYAFMATAMTSSEGENIIMNIGKMAETLREFIHTGDDNSRGNRISKAFARAVWGDKVDNQEVSNERWILLDAIDSGLSVDNIVDVKNLLFKTILEDAKKLGLSVFIIVSANEYEMCNGEQCFDVQMGKYREFKTYNSYRKFILNSKAKKMKRYEDYDKKINEKQKAQI